MAGLNRHQAALLTFVIIYPLVHFVVPAVRDHVDISPALQELLSIAIIVALMSYVCMPVAHRLVAGFRTRNDMKRTALTQRRSV